MIIKNINVALYIASVTGNDFELVKGDKKGQVNFKFEMIQANWLARNRFEKAFIEFKQGHKDEYLKLKREINCDIKSEFYTRKEEAIKRGEI